MGPRRLKPPLKTSHLSQRREGTQSPFCAQFHCPPLARVVHEDGCGFERARLPAAPSRAKTSPALAAGVGRLGSVLWWQRVCPAGGLKPQLSDAPFQSSFINTARYGAGSNCSGHMSRAVVPAEMPTSSSSGGLKLPLVGTRLASPLMSVVTLLWLTLRITGIAGFVGLVSPLPPAGGAPPGRITVV